ncbi:hypothetical protein TNCV_1600381 [Trichonephila clavipes]|nr:hypothetical protein TNCV_1600381 [Trichonephila clavipes]
MIPLEKFGPVEKSSDLALHLCIRAFRSLHFIDKFISTIAVRTLLNSLYVTGDDLLLLLTTQLHTFRQCDHVRNHSVAYNVFEDVVMASFVFPLGTTAKMKTDKFSVSITGFILCLI